MLDKHIIDERICHVKRHGDNAQDILDLAMLMYVKEHIDEVEDVYERHAMPVHHMARETEHPMRSHMETLEMLGDLYNAASGKDRDIIKRAIDEIQRV